MPQLPHLPPLLALRAFEAVGRLSSFRRAGEELLITQSAVSHHIRRLEHDVGTRLFIRGGRDITLTAPGARYLAQVRLAFELIADGTADLMGRSDRVRLSLLPSFAANWLVPRLASLRAAYPALDLILDPTLRLADLDAGEADLAIRYGDGQWDGGGHHLLMAERLTPVLSPVLQARSPIHRPQDLLGHTLLQTSRPVDWAIWGAAAGVDLAEATTLQLTDYNIVLQAALDAQGVAVGRMSLVAARVRAGDLVAPCGPLVSTPNAAYWLITSQRRAASPAAEAFRAWLIQQAQLDSTHT